jgi:hypothetical protein
MKHAVLAFLISSIVLPAADSPVKLTGWFACEKCAASRVAKGDLRPSNPECAKQCIEKGDNAVFIDEQGKQLLRVKGYASVTGDLGYHVEVTGRIDSSSPTIVVESVTKLGDAGASCARPVKKTAE